ncbi:hypothetical protein SDC9_128379 [bioreactor metagenome]|uniref:Uncharacterized protein n=1 Tax=bioreactor metagenome TaxID=1076179 RepID=A0A645CWN5_9ZZZZ
MVNLLSPHPYLFWLTVGSPIIVKAYMQGLTYAAAFVMCFYLSLIGAKIILAIVVNRSRSFLEGKMYIYIMRVLGFVLMFFALFLLNDGYRLLTS